MPSAVGGLRPGWELQHDDSASATDAGDRVPEWRKAATVYAAVEPLTGKELERLREVQPQATHRARIRCSRLTCDTSARWRLIYRDRHRGRTRVFHLAEPPREAIRPVRYLEVLVVEKEPEDG